MRNRAIITNVKPIRRGGHYYIKRTPGEKVTVGADIFCDGDDILKAAVLYKKDGEKQWQESPMLPSHEGERWTGNFVVESEGFYHYKIEAWVDHLATWYHGFQWKHNVGQNLSDHLAMGSVWLRKAAAQADKETAKQMNAWADQFANRELSQESVATALSESFGKVMATHTLRQHSSTFDLNLRVRVGSQREMYSTWYLMFPRSASSEAGKHGTFKDCEKLLTRISNMGFDVLFLPPIFPIGETNRKGKNNSVTPEKDDVGSPWSVGNKYGGHKSVHPELGQMKDFEQLVKKARALGMDVALDMSLRCSADHPYITEHPDWFHRLPDGSLAVEEVPPLNYQDIVDFDFECDDYHNLWLELKSVFLFWAKKGVRLFYASTPHHKPFAFWNWLIAEVQKEYPDAVFLSGAFTRSVIGQELAKAGFDQSFTYFIWRNSDKDDLIKYMNELTEGPSREYMRPNFFTNTPDILPSYLADQGVNSFQLQYALASMLSSNCGVYGPAFELMDNKRYPESRERYLHSEKFELRQHDWSANNRLMDFITKINAIRKANPALQNTFNITFTKTDNDNLMSFVKSSNDGKNIVWCVVNMDPHRTHSGYIEVPKDLLGLRGKWFNLEVKDLLSGETYYWFNDWNFVELKPDRYPIHVMKVEIK